MKCLTLFSGTNSSVTANGSHTQYSEPDDNLNNGLLHANEQDENNLLDDQQEKNLSDFEGDQNQDEGDDNDDEDDDDDLGLEMEKPITPGNF